VLDQYIRDVVDDEKAEKTGDLATESPNPISYIHTYIRSTCMLWMGSHVRCYFSWRLVHGICSINRDDLDSFKLMFQKKN
jgi:hypothetical protein